METETVLAWLHVGDLHITEAGQDNHRDLHRIADAFRRLPQDAADFMLLPGDNADDGMEAQFALVRKALAGLAMTVHILPGDHDFKPGSLDAFNRVLGAEALPKAATVRGYRCLFLDVVSAGSGGPDFRLDAGQLEWLEREVDEAERACEPVAVFMHTYPADLRAGAEPLRALLDRPHVFCVDMGHTHYNELANDGSTIFMATRSTGQIEEGPVGFSMAAVDAGGVSWRFKPLNSAWPFVLITRPVDRRLATERNAPAPAAPVRALVVGDAPIESVEVRWDDGSSAPMRPERARPHLWTAPPDAVGQGRVSVRARDALGRHDTDAVEPCFTRWLPPARTRDGSDRDRTGPWPEKGVVGSQLGPNRNGRKW
ncbi:MAG: metallophosphoesterase [Acetobacteraceae bacterium]|nr:metallophosphoesterase [Acetobacteraceae bacterium]